MSAVSTQAFTIYTVVYMLKSTSSDCNGIYYKHYSIYILNVHGISSDCNGIHYYIVVYMLKIYCISSVCNNIYFTHCERSALPVLSAMAFPINIIVYIWRSIWSAVSATAFTINAVVYMLKVYIIRSVCNGIYFKDWSIYGTSNVCNGIH